MFTKASTLAALLVLALTIAMSVVQAADGGQYHGRYQMQLEQAQNLLAQPSK